MIAGGHREKVRFKTMKDFQLWYQKVLLEKEKNDPNQFINVPLTMAGKEEYLIVRPASIQGIRVEPVYTTSIDRDEVE